MLGFRSDSAFDKPSLVSGGKGLQIVGPVCESGDVLRKDAPLLDVAVNDVLLFLEAGAYCRSMSSEYNLRKLPETVYVRGEEVIASENN
jgi:diaminopimelate decarboxylase